MQVSRVVILIVAWAALLTVATRRVVAQGQDHVTINIPKKIRSSPTSIVPIGEVKAVVSLSNGSPVTFTFSDQSTPVQQMSIGPIGPGDSAQSVTFGQEDTSSLGGDKVTVTPPSSSVPATDPARFRYEIDIQLKSNFDANCVNKQIVDPNFYKVQITPTSTTITAVCVESFDGHPRPTGLNSCTNTNPSNPNFALYEVPIPLDNSADTVATATLNPDTAPVSQPRLACFKARPAVDVVMVLDKSGSMLTPLTAGEGAFCSGSADRIGALRCAANRFLGLWDAGANPPFIPGDRAGVVSFSSSASTDAPLAAVTPGETIPNIVVGGSTSIGAGLHQADDPLWSGTNRKVVLLMTDGQQNTDPKVEVVPSTGLYCDTAANCTGLTRTGSCDYTSGNPCPLTNHPAIYTVTLGPSTGNPQAIQQAIDSASLGFYLHTDTNGNLLSPFFLELLQNFLRFNSYETVRMISDKASGMPYSADVPISTTSHDVEFSLMWPKDLGALRMTVTPPGGAPAIVKEDASGFIVLIQSLPLPAPFDPKANWHIEVKAIDLPSVIATTGANAGSIPFDLHIMTDDAGVKSDLSVVPGDYKTGDNIRLRAKLRYFGLPILGLGSHPGDTIKVDLLKPGQGVGDFLSDSTASSTPPRPDIDPGAEAKLFNAVQSTPLGVVPQRDITLLDDGKPEHGDDVAGDGIYSALIPATLSGDYNFVFSVESTDPNSLRFSRQQLRAAYVRAVPDAGNTVFQSSILRRDNGNVLSIVMTPRVKPGPGCRKSDPKCGRMGPGWANYFWFTTPGQAPFKAVDNLNGTYTATLAFTGSNPPPVSVHFENVLAVIGDSVTPDHLPAPLGPATIFERDCCKLADKFAVFFDLGPNFPHGSFGSVFNTGVSLNAGLEYILQPHLSLEGIFGYHYFPGSLLGDLNVYQFSVNGKTYLTNGTIRPFVNGGIGGYKFSPGSTYFGGNFGGGVLFNLTSRFGLQGSYNFHVVDTTGGATKYSSVQLGFRLVR